MAKLNQFKKLDAIVQKAIIKRCELRKERFLGFTKMGIIPVAKVLLVGDCPAPDAPDDLDFHYTPFGALWHSSLYLNVGLHSAKISEENLAWINAADHKKNPTKTDILEFDWPQIIALGGAAEKWIKRAGYDCVKFDHPAYHKRFHNKRPYPLFDFLKEKINVC